ncbi:MAG: type IV secretion system DNA-binding domain-containing protein, partial [Candidatus Heimdallarchaeota archaeon]|nr:type IV secretion system DNA-binding domain-containing protein [Candidatus Heimdallarchaeota archaeon]
MVDAGKLSDLLKQAEEYEENGDYQKAKLIYLDAAELALKFSKQSVKNKVKFETIAAQFIEKAKNTDLLINLSKIDSIPEKSNNNKADTKSTTGKAKSPNDGLIFASSKSSSIDFSKFPFNKTKIEPTIPFGLHTELGNHVDWNPNEEMNGFMMMVGGSGSGKTDGLKSLITELVERGYPCLVLDLHGDIEVPITSINFDFTGEYSINPLKITSLDKGEGGAIPKINQMLDSFQDSIESKFSANMITELRKTLIDLYKKMGIVQKVPDTWSRNPPNFENLNQYLNLLKDTTEARTTYLA